MPSYLAEESHSRCLGTEIECPTQTSHERHRPDVAQGALGGQHALLEWRRHSSSRSVIAKGRLSRPGRIAHPYPRALGGRVRLTLSRIEPRVFFCHLCSL